MIFSFSFTAEALESTIKKKSLQKRRNHSQPISSDKSFEEKPKSRSKTSDLLAIPVGIIGYGLGHGLQGRYSSRGWMYTLVDIAAMGYVGITMGSCRPSDQSCENNKDQSENIALALIVGSRLAQIIDLTYFFSQQTYADYRAKNNFQFVLVPDQKGSLQATLNWSF